jgi:hypothetical protein
MNLWDDPTRIRPWSKSGLYSWLVDYGHLEVVAYGTKRNWLHVPFEPIFILYISSRGVGFSERHCHGETWLAGPYSPSARSAR